MTREHPEAHPDEVWTGNHRVDQWRTPELAQLKTPRHGVQAYDIEGKRLPRDLYVPVFVHKSEYAAYDRAMMASIEAIIRKWGH